MVGVGTGDGVGISVGLGVGVGRSVGLGVGDGVGISVGLGVGVAVSVGLGDAVGSVGLGLGSGDPGGIGAPGARRRVVVRAARITVPSPLLLAGWATGLRSAEGLGLTSGAGLVPTGAGEGLLAAVGR